MAMAMASVSLAAFSMTPVPRGSVAGRAAVTAVTRPPLARSLRPRRRRQSAPLTMAMAASTSCGSEEEEKKSKQAQGNPQCYELHLMEEPSPKSLFLKARDGLVKMAAVALLSQQLALAPPVQAIEDPSESLASALQSFLSGDTAAFLNHFTDDFVFTNVGTPSLPYAGEYKGKDALAQFVGKSAKFLDSELLDATFSGDPKRNIAILFATYADKNPKTGETLTNKCLFWEQQNTEGKSLSITEICNSLGEFEILNP